MFLVLFAHFQHLQEHAATKEEWLNRLLLPSRLDLVFHVRDRPEASRLTNFLSTQAGKVLTHVFSHIVLLVISSVGLLFYTIRVWILDNNFAFESFGSLYHTRTFISR